MLDDNLVRGRTLGDVAGYEITDLDVKTLREGPQAERIRALLYEHQMLCFRDQELEPADMIEFTRLFGSPDPNHLERFIKPGYPEIMVLSNIVEDGKPLGATEIGFGWHTDMTYMALPSAYTLIYGIENPKAGGDTRYASLYKAYDSLPEDEKAFLRPLWGTYQFAQLYALNPNAPELTEAQKALTPDVLHPLVRIHPHTGREGMYINYDDFVGVEGFPVDEMRARVAALIKHATENFAYDHKWHDRDLVMWDNRGLMHTATPYDRVNDRRYSYRIMVQGEKPIGWSDVHPAA